MIFQYTWQSILDEKKTQTRRVIAANEIAIRAKHNQIMAVISNGRLKWKVGQTYAVQIGRGKPEIARIQITRINSEQVTRISSADAKAEGFNSRQEFINIWKQIHGEDSLHQKIWIVNFELVGVFINREIFSSVAKLPVDSEKLIYAAR